MVGVCEVSGNEVSIHELRTDKCYINTRVIIILAFIWILQCSVSSVSHATACNVWSVLYVCRCVISIATGV